jgi:hypothetical protein
MKELERILARCSGMSADMRLRAMFRCARLAHAAGDVDLCRALRCCAIALDRGDIAQSDVEFDSVFILSWYRSQVD